MNVKVSVKSGQFCMQRLKVAGEDESEGEGESESEGKCRSLCARKSGLGSGLNSVI